MRVLVWLVGQLVISLGVMVSRAIAPAWSWVWLCVVVLWLFVGAAMVVGSLLRVASKAGGGAKTPRGAAPRMSAPPPTGDE